MTEARTKSGSRAAGRNRAESTADYLSVSETQALMAQGLDARQERLKADDMLSTSQAAALLNTTPVTINNWIAKGRAIGLTQTKRGFRMPKWQFETSLWEALPQISAGLQTREGWALLNFLETPHGGLGGFTPRQAIEQGKAARVIELAKGDGF